MGHRTAGDQEVCKIKRSKGGEFQNRSKLKAMYGYSLIASWEVFRLFLRLVGGASKWSSDFGCHSLVVRECGQQ